MQNLEKRIAVLEATGKPTDDTTIIRKIVSHGHIDAEISRLCDYDGNQWERSPGETEQELIDRATLEVKRNFWGVACMTADAGMVPHAEH